MLDPDDPDDLRIQLDQENDDDIADQLFRITLIQNQQIGETLMKLCGVMANIVVSSLANKRAGRRPYHTSILTGRMWVQELLDGHPDRIRNELGVRKHVFARLVEELTCQGVAAAKGGVALEEQVAIFLYTCVTGLSFRHVGKRFQHSTATISKYFHLMVEQFAFSPIYLKYVKLPRSDDPTPDRIMDDPAVYPYFKDAIGAIDGTHIACTPSAPDRDATRNRKGFHSQNCLVACNFDLEFVYVFTGGWEGLMADASVYHDTRKTDFTIPSNRYYIADAGYPICPQLLVPYRDARYHPSECGRTDIEPSNSQEYFNLRHAQLRNVVERIIGVLKKRFRILVIPPAFPMENQVKIPPALCCIHNIIRKYDPDEFSELDSPVVECQEDREHVFGSLATGFITPGERDCMMEKRDAIAKLLWEDYNRTP